MKQQKMSENRKKWTPYLIILICVLILEVFVFNISTWKTLRCEPVVLAKNVVTNEKGVFSTDFVEIQDDVLNVNVDLTITGYDRAFVSVALTDEGDYYAYDMPSYTVVPEVTGCGYQNIYPFGKVNTIKIVVSVPEGTQARIESIAVNVQRAFDFKIFRVVLLWGIAVLGYVMFAGTGAATVPCQRKNKFQSRIIVGVILFLVILAGLLVRSNPICVNSPWPHHRQYQELARAMAQGTVVIGETPDAALLAKENPYDTSALLAENIPFKMDYALYDGHYYAYFGIVPELLFYFPFYLLTGKDLPNYLVVFALYSGMLIGIFGTIWEMVQRYTKKVPFLTYLVLGVGVSLLPYHVFLIARPDIYNVAVMSGNMFLWLGAFFWLKAVNIADESGYEETGKIVNCIVVGKKNYCWLWYGLGAFSFACIMGCRPQMALYAAALFCVLFIPRILKEWKQWNVHIKEVIAFLIPVILVGIVVFWYNWARFGSGLDFGASYSLTSNDMNHRGFNLSRTVRGLYSFLFQPPVINSTFPFLESCELESNYMGKNIVEFSYGGIFAVCPILFSLFYVVLGGWKSLNKEIKGFIGSLCAASIIIAAFDINAAGILQRYMCDMVFGLVLAAVLVIFVLLDKKQGIGIYSWVLKGAYLCFVFNIAFSFLVVITSADSICLENYNPVLFHEIASYFKF